MPKKNIIGLIVIVAIAIIVGGLSLTKKTDTSKGIAKDNSNIPSSTTDTPASNTTPTSNPNSSTTGYKDGNYTANGSYSSPGGNESIDVTVTLKDGKVVSTSANPQAASRESMEYQDEFVNGYQKLVIGKDISKLKLSRVSGSSLTSQGFNEAIEKIKSQAQS